MKVTIKFHPIAYHKAVRNVIKSNIETNRVQVGLIDRFTAREADCDTLSATVKKQMARLERCQPQNKQKVADKLLAAQQELSEATADLKAIKELSDDNVDLLQEPPVRREYLTFLITRKEKVAKEPKAKKLRYNPLKAMYNSFINSRIRHHEKKMKQHTGVVNVCADLLVNYPSRNGYHPLDIFVNSWAKEFYNKYTKKAADRRNKCDELKLKLFVMPAPSKLSKFFTAVTKPFRAVARFVNRFIVRPIVIAVEWIVSAVFALSFLAVFLLVLVVVAVIILIPIGVIVLLDKIRDYRWAKDDKAWENIKREARENRREAEGFDPDVAVA